MERMWCGEASQKYPKQWIVMVNIKDEIQFDEKYGKYYKPYGDVYFVSPNEEEAYAEEMKIGASMGVHGVFEGFNDTPMIGGLYL